MEWVDEKKLNKSEALFVTLDFFVISTPQSPTYDPRAPEIKNNANNSCCGIKSHKSLILSKKLLLYVLI